MPDLDDFQFAAPEEPGGPPPPVPPEPGLPVALIGLAFGGLVLAGAATFWLLGRAPREPAGSPTPTAPASRLAAPPAASPLPPLPALEMSDALVRELAAAASTNPRLLVWVAQPGLVRRFVAVVDNIANGEPPRAHLAFLAPEGSFTAVERQGRLVIDPASYARYDPIADTVASLDTTACAAAFVSLEPLFEAAYRELGHPEGGFRSALSRAAGVLESLPRLDPDLAVHPVPRAQLVYELIDPGLEALSPAQKHLLRMGPRNAGKVQAKLRAVLEALGPTPVRPAPSATPMITPARPEAAPSESGNRS